MASYYCGDCIYLNFKDKKYGNEYYCPKSGKYRPTTYSGCSDWKNEKGEKNSSAYKPAGCYITTITCNILGYADDCEVLSCMRHLRDNYLKQNPDMLPILYEYDIIGPMISKKISEEENKEKLAMELLKNFLIPCAQNVKNKDYASATHTYINMFNLLKIKYGFNGMQYVIENTPIEELGKGRIRNNLIVDNN